MQITRFDFKDKLLYFIIILLGCHQFPILRAGGSFKIYELLGLVLMFYNIITYSKLNKPSTLSFWALLFFIIVPVITYLYSNVFLDYPSGFFSHYIANKKQKVTSFRFSYYLFPVLQLMLLAMNYTVFVSLWKSNAIYINFNRVIKSCIAMGTIIALYSLFALFVVDVIPSLPSIIQFKSAHPGRSTGFSQEPGTYVFYQAWICLFIFYSKHLYKSKTWYLLFIINGLSFVLTISSTLLGFVAIVLFVQITYLTSVSKQMKAWLLIILTVIIMYGLVIFFNLQHTMEVYFVEKLEHFFSGHKNNNTLTSGAARNYYNSIGYRIFYDNIIFGVGQGRSQFYMYLYEYKMGIRTFGERLMPGTMPMGVLPLVMAEDGLIGLIALCFFYGFLILKFWLNRGKSPYHKMFLIGNLFLCVFFFTLFPVYHLFFWAYAGLGLGYIRYFDKKNNLKENVVLSV